MADGLPSPGRVRVVFDANVFIQALLSGRGPAAACVQLAFDRFVDLSVTESILEEIEGVLVRLSKKPRYSATLPGSKIAEFMEILRNLADIEPPPPSHYQLARDPDDEVYLNLAIEVGAVFLASRDSDLLDLMSLETPAGNEFRSRFPNLEILNPIEFLRRVMRDN